MPGLIVLTAIAASLLNACSFSPPSNTPTKNLSVKVLRSAVTLFWSNDQGEYIESDGHGAWQYCLKSATTEDIFNKVLGSTDIKVVSMNRYEESTSYPTLFDGVKSARCRGTIYILEGPTSTIEEYSFLSGYSRVIN
jgi:hypothetical protein